MNDVNDTTSAAPAALRIIRLEIENVKRVHALSVQPNGAPVVRVEGANGAGKSSALDAIAYALGGEKMIAERPVTDGEATARITLDLGELIVERRWTGGGERTYLEVRARDGAKYRSPQAILDGLCSRVAFDPLAFVREEPRRQAETLRRLAGLDLSAIDAERQRAYDARTEANREAKSLEARLAAHPEDPGAPPREEDVAALLEEQRCAHATIATSRDVRDAVRIAMGRSESAAITVEKCRRALEDAERALQERRSEVATAEAREASLPPNPDLDAIDARIRTAGATNARVQRARARAALADEVAVARQWASALDTQVAAAEEAKRAAIASAAWPVEGLGIDGDAVTWRGLPLAQASSAEQLRVSAAVGFALNPRAKVLLVREGSLLDAESMRLLGEMARANGGQVWIERVGDGELSVVIEDWLSW